MLTRNKPARTSHRSVRLVCRGFTLIELMIVIAIIAIIMTLALPVYSNYTVRAKIAESMSLANSVKVTVAATCHENPTLADIDNEAVGYAFGVTEYVQDIQVHGSCLNAVITITTQNTGQSPAPVLSLTGRIESESSVIPWTCSSDNTPNHLLPTACRSG